MEQLQRAYPYETGVDPKAITKLIKALEQKQIAIHSLMIMRHNKVIAEGWCKPYCAEYNHMMFSLSKSFTSTAIGFAVQEGLLTVEDTVLSFFEEMLPCKPCENMQKMKIKHLLSMSTGHDTEPNIFTVDDGKWIYAFLTSYVALEPGSKFLYNTAASYMLSAILQKVTGVDLVEYLRPRLLEPLNLSDGVWCEKSPEDICTGGFGFYLQTEDIAKFATFLLNKGAYDGNQLLNSAWIDEATKKQIDNGSDINSDWSQGYGYQFWRCKPEGSFRGDGAFGQYCIVLPKQDMIFAFTGGMGDMQQLLKEIWINIIPSIKDVLPENKLDQLELKKVLEGLEIQTLCGSSIYNNELMNYSDVKYTLSDNPVLIETVDFNFGEQSTMTISIGGKESIITIGDNEWIESKVFINIPSPITAAVSFGEKTTIFERISAKGTLLENKLSITMAFTNTPFVDTWDIQFDNKGIIVDFKRNVGFFPISCRFYGR